jgi:hypothetical protein
VIAQGGTGKDECRHIFGNRSLAPAKPPLLTCRYLPFQFAGSQAMADEASAISRTVVWTSPIAHTLRNANTMLTHH